MTDRDEIRAALTYIDPHSREMWIKIGAALKDELDQDGFDLWDHWSQQSDNYNARAARDVWKSLKPGNVRIGSLFYEARQNGWAPSKPYTPPTAEELAKRQQEAAQRQRAEAEATRRAQAKAQRTAQSLWQKNLSAQPDHPYFVRKGITDPAVIRQFKQSRYQGQTNLLIPVYQDKELVSMQFIGEDGSKRFLSGGKMQGSYTLIGDSSRLSEGVVIAEGVATGASVYQATGLPVVVAFNAGNLTAVSEKLAAVLPEHTPVIFAADNDVSQTGLTKARQAAEVFGERAQIVLPQFDEKQIAQYQKQYGSEALPSDFNDLALLAGDESVKAVFEPLMARFRQPEGLSTGQSETQAEPEIMVDDSSAWPKAERTDWGDFPRLIRNGPLREMQNHTDYTAAKAGDARAAASLVHDLMTEETLQAVKEMVGNRQPIVVGVRAEESVGRNKIPDTMAALISTRNGWEQDNTIKQQSYVGRTGKGSDFRLAFPPTFTGNVQAERDYLIVDDNATQGGTIANLKGYIESHGGHVLGAVVMSARETGLDVAITSDMIEKILNKHGEAINDYWKQEFGYGIDKLTYHEGGTVRSAANLDAIRTRIHGARVQQGRSMGEGVFPNKAREAAPESRSPHQVNEAAPKAASVLSAPPQQEPATADKAVFLRPQKMQPERQEIEMPKKSVNSIEYDHRRHETDAQKPVEQTAESPEASTPNQTAHREHQRPSGLATDTETVKKPVTDLSYKMPPSSLEERYIVAEGKYLSAQNGTTVLFEDQGNSLRAAKVDAQTVKDMVEVVKAKGWDAIKLNGTKEFKAMMFVEAESQGIRTSGYTPTAADLALLERRRSQNNLNGIEINTTPKPKTESSRESETHTTQQDREQKPPQQDKQSNRPDPLLMSAAERMEAQNRRPDAAQVNQSPRADTDDTLKIDAIGQESLPPQVGKAADALRQSAIQSTTADNGFQAAHDNYQRKAAKLSRSAQATLRFYERTTRDVVRGLDERTQREALRNFYEYTAKHMKGSKLELPEPLRSTEQQHTPEQPEPTHSIDKDYDIER